MCIIFSKINFYIKTCFFLLLFCLILLPNSAQATSLTPNGEALKEYYDSLNVENLWQKGYEVNWESGESIKKAINVKTTHCSAFVASVLKRNGIYILRPPEHRLKNLANAQFDYLASEEAKQDGWNRIEGSYEEVQMKANEGYFVVAVVKNENPEDPGHIAFVYPHEFDGNEVENNGPYLIQAGYINAKGISLREGFEKHYKDFSKLHVRFYYYSVVFKELAS